MTWFRYFGDRGSSICLFWRGFEAGLRTLFIDPISLGDAVPASTPVDAWAPPGQDQALPSACSGLRDRP